MSDPLGSIRMDRHGSGGWLNGPEGPLSWRVELAVFMWVVLLWVSSGVPAMEAASSRPAAASMAWLHPWVNATAGGLSAENPRAKGRVSSIGRAATFSDEPERGCGAGSQVGERLRAGPAPREPERRRTG